MYKNFQDTLLLLLPKERRNFFLFALSDALIAFLDIALLTCLLALVNFYIQPGNSVQSFLNPFFEAENRSVTALVLLGLFIIKNVVAFTAFAAQYRFVYAVASRLSQKKIGHFLNGTYRQFVDTDASVHIKQISQQPVEFAHYVLNGWQQLITQFILLLFTATVVLIYNPLIFLLLIFLLLPPLFIAVYFAKRKTAHIKAGIKEESENALQYLKEALAGFTESRLYGKNEFFSRRYSAKQFLLNRSLSQLQVVQALPARLMEIFAVAGFVLLVVISSYSNTAVEFFTIGALMAAAYKIIPGAAKMVNHAALIKTYAYTLKDIHETNAAESNAKAVKKTGIIEFKNISFRYRHPVLQQFNCSIEPGDFIGMSAASGKGKTTFINLLLGFEEENEGTVLFNNKPVTAKDRQQYWNDIAYVKQQPFLIYDTIEKNITLDDAAADKEHLTAVTEITGINNWLACSNKGLQTVVTENGKNISGGQRQRIAIARALYKNAGLLILDETFSELDEASAIKLLEYFKQQAQLGKTVILITHDKESLSYCNKIISIDEQQ